MAVKVYVDVLFLTNLIFDYILLWASAAFVKKTPKPFKMLLASSVGAFFAIIAFFCAKNTAVIVFFQLLTSSLMIILVFGVKDFFCCVQMSAVLFVTAFTLGGALLYLVKTDGVIFSGGAFYVDINTTMLFGAGIITYVLSSISYGVVLKKREDKQGSYTFTVSIGEEEVTLNGYFDSGNCAKDENGRGIVFVNPQKFENALNKGIKTEKIIVKTAGGGIELDCFYAEKVSTEKAFNQPKRKIAFLKEEIIGEGDAILPNDFFDYI